MNRRVTKFSLLFLFIFYASLVCGQTIHNMTPGTYIWGCSGNLIYLDHCTTLNNISNYGVNWSPPNAFSNFNYLDNQLTTETICTSNGQCLNLNPNAFPSTWGIHSGDTLWVYAGNSASGTPLATYTNNLNTNPTTILSVPQPCVTFKFKSNTDDTTGKGWRFDISCVSCPSAPANDSYTGAIPLTVGSSCTYTTGNTYFASSAATCSTAPVCTGPATPGNPDDDVWYTFTTGPTQTTATVRVQSISPMDAVFQVFSGTCGSFTQVTCQNSSGAGGFETATFAVTASTTYYVRVYDASTFAGANNPINPDPFQICVTGAVGSDCGGAAQVCSTAQISHNNTGGVGTQEYGTGNWGCLFGEHNSAWYLFKANATGSLSFNIASNGGSFQDIDFGLWGPFASAGSVCTLTPILSSSYAVSNANPGCGLPAYSTGLSSCELGGTNCEPAGGNGNLVAFNQPVIITLNNWYLLLVDIFGGNTNYFINWVSNPPIDCLLPIDLLTFTGQNDGEFNTLNWTTASEENNKYFVLERSADGKSFNEIASIPGAGFSNSPITYAYEDQHPVHRINYYRLKQIDFDGSYTYSNVVTIDNRTDSQFSPVIYPNPGFGIFNMSIYSKEKSTGTIDVFNSIGQLIMEQQISVDEGDNISAVDLTGFNEGIYTLRLTIGKFGEIFTKKIVKL